MKNIKVLVTGGSGQLAQEIKSLSQDYEDFEFFFYSRVDLDITKRNQVNKVFSEIKPDYIINAAAYTQVDLAESNKNVAFDVNAYALQNIVHEAEEARIIHISTDYVYHSLNGNPLKESSPTTPKSVYAKSKLLGEEFLSKSESKHIIIRTSWVYGVQGKNFVSTILRLARIKKDLKIIDDQIGAPTYALDIASTILQIIKGTESYKITDNHWNQIYNYANLGKISWFEFASRIVESANISVNIYPIKTYEYPVAAKRPAWSVMNLEKISQLPGIDIYDWKERLEHCLRRIIN